MLKICGYFLICTTIISLVLYYFEEPSRPTICEDYDPIINPTNVEMCGYVFMGNELIYLLVSLISFLLLVGITIIIRSQSQVNNDLK